MDESTHQPPSPSDGPTEASPGRWRAILTPRALLELFLLGNLAFLAIDIFIAHSYNQFGSHSLHAYARWAEWVPIGFSLAAPLLLLMGMLAGGLTAPERGIARPIGLLIGASAIVVGVAGLLFHLNSQFFALRTLKSLVYTAPFAAPLSYGGLGLLLILNRCSLSPRQRAGVRESDDRPFKAPHPNPLREGKGEMPASQEWAGWVLLLAAAGFLGNFILSLADHATNGFFVWTEWMPVVASAFAFAFLMMPLLMRTGPGYLWISAAILALQAAIGFLGFSLHLWADLHAPSASLRDQLVNGAPIFAPLLFTNLAILAAIGLWAMARSPLQDSSPPLPHPPIGRLDVAGEADGVGQG